MKNDKSSREYTERLKFKKIEASRLEELHKTFELWTVLNKNNITKYDKILNIIIYVILVNNDIFYLCEDFNLEKNGLRKNFYGRMLSMTIYEYLDNVNYLLGKQFIDELKAHNLDRLIEDLRTISKTYSIIKKEHKNELKEIRNNASAHKNMDSRKLYKIYTEFHVQHLKELTFALSFVESTFFDIITEVYNEIFTKP